MSRPARFRGTGLAALALWLLVSATVGCASLPRPGGPSEAPRVLAVLPPAPPPVWRRSARELAVAHGLYVYRAWEMRSLGRLCVVYGLRPGGSLERTVSRLASDPRVESAQPVQRFRVLSGPAPGAGSASGAGAGRAGDPYAHLQHGASALGAPAAHRWATGLGVRVALVDTGVDVGHPDLAGRVESATNFVEHGSRSFTRDVHGTAMAGIVAAVRGNGVGIAGVAPDAGLLAYKACWPRQRGGADAVCDSYTLAQAVDTAIGEEVHVINLSLTGPRDPLLSRLLGEAGRRGIAVVAAATGAPPEVGFPASLPGVLAVTADQRVGGDVLRGEGGAGGGVGSTERRPVASSPGEGEIPVPAGAPPDGGGAGGGDGAEGVVVAPGLDVLTTVPGGSYDFFSGSSVAAAHVAGVAALMLEREPDLAPDELARRLRESAVPIAGGPALVDACRAVADLLELPDACPGPVRRAR